MDKTPEEEEKSYREKVNRIWLHIFGIKEIKSEESEEQKRIKELEEQNRKLREAKDYENKMKW